MALEDESKLMAEVFDKTPSAFIILDKRGVISKANQAAHLLLGEEVLVGRRWVEIIEEVFRPRSDDGHEISTREGKRLAVSTLALSCGQLVQMTDLTVTRKLQEKLSHLERLSSLGRMAASLAHQIRTPLSAAMLYAANLGSPKLNAQAKTAFQAKLMSRLEDLEAQVSDILMFAKSGEQTVSLVNARDIMHEVLGHAESITLKYQASLIAELGDEDLPILGNASALGGALTNLINNAVEAGAGEVRLSLKKEGSEVLMSVANNGPAIDPKLKDKIFEPFYTSKSHGTGLGLAVVSAVAKVHQGRVVLQSSEQYPTIFTIILPSFTRPKVKPGPKSPFVKKDEALDERMIKAA